MNKIFSKIGALIEKSPFKVLFVSLAVIIIMITGALKVNMATGNETLVKTDSEAYISNYEMEEEFGGDAIMVLLAGDEDDLLSQENIEKMWNVEERLKYNDNIYSFLSPASIVHQITDKQGEQIKENLPEISDGLGTMSEKLIQIGNELGTKELPDPSELDAKLDELMANMDPNSMMEDMLRQQEVEMAKMNEDVAKMSSGLGEMGDRLIGISSDLSSKEVPNPKEIEKKLDALMEGMNPEQLPEEIKGQFMQMNKEIEGMKSSLSGGISPDELQTMANGLSTMGSNLKEISGVLSNLPDKMAEMASSLQDPSAIFSGMMTEVEAEVAQMKGNLSGGIDPEELGTMADGFVTMGENLADLSEGLEIFHEKSGMMKSNIPHNQEELDFILYDDDGGLKEIFADTIIDDNHLMMMIKLQGNIEDSVKDEVYEEVAQAMAAENFGNKDSNVEDKSSILALNVDGEEEFQDGEVSYLISGKPVLDSSLRAEMQTNMQRMVVLAGIVMVIVLFLVFKVRWSILSIPIIMVSVIGTLGLMGHLSVSMTMVSMAVFPILIGLGIDFSIQFHNRYEEELSVTASLTQTGRAIATAVFATMLGFISLYASPVPMIQDFGKMLTIGVVVSFFGSIFILMPILQIRDIYNPKGKKSESLAEDAEDGGLIGSVLGRVAKFVTKHAVFVILIAVVFASLGLYADTKVGVETDIESFMPQDMEALEDIRYVRDVVGSTDQMVLFMEDDNILSEENVSWIEDKVEDIEYKYSEEIEDIKSIGSLVENMSDKKDLSYEEYIDLVADLPENQRSMFINEDETNAAIIINIKHMAIEELEDFVGDLDKDLQDAPMKVTVTGKSVLDVEMVEGLTDGRVKMTILGMILVFIGMLFVYRNPVKALIPVIPIILIVGMSGGSMHLLGLSYTPITATLGALILGMGTETTIMIVERYMEERESGKNKADAMDITVSRIGKATLSTELTTMGGFAVLMFSNFVILRDFGLMTVINVSLVLVSTFVVLPALIWLLDRFIIKEEN